MKLSLPLEEVQTPMPSPQSTPSLGVYMVYPKYSEAFTTPHRAVQNPDYIL